MTNEGIVKESRKALKAIDDSPGNTPPLFALWACVRALRHVIAAVDEANAALSAKPKAKVAKAKTKTKAKT